MRMSVFLEKQNVIPTLLIMGIVNFVMYCTPPATAPEDELVIENELSMTDTVAVNKSEPEETRVAYVKDKALIFFRLGSKEYQSLLNKSGQVASFDLKLLFQRFSGLADEFSSNLRQYGIDSELLYEKKIIFIKDSGEYVFDRVKRDMLMGQIFFNGKDSILVEEGYMDPSDLTEEIKSFFEIDSLRINLGNIRLAADTIYNRDTIPTQVKDTLIQKDSISSGT